MRYTKERINFKISKIFRLRYRLSHRDSTMYSVNVWALFVRLIPSICSELTHQILQKQLDKHSKKDKLKQISKLKQLTKYKTSSSVDLTRTLRSGHSLQWFKEREILKLMTNQVCLTSTCKLQDLKDLLFMSQGQI